MSSIWDDWEGRGGGSSPGEKILPLITSRCKLTTNGCPQEPLTEWMRTIDVLFNTIIALKIFSPMAIIFITCEM